jgi:hypothetical protein
MKRVIALLAALCCVLLLGGCLPKQAPLERKDYDSVEEMAKAAPYAFWLPTTLPEGFVLDSVWSMGDETFRFLYKNGEREIVWSVSQYTADPSGDRGDYSIFQTRTIYKYTLAMKSNDGVHFLSVFSQKQDRYTIGYAINGATEEELFTLLGGLQAYRPKIAYDSVTAMLAKADFAVWLPTALPEGFVQGAAWSLADEVFRVAYNSGERELVLSVSVEDRTPADEEEQGAYVNRDIGGYRVKLYDRGDGVSLATWTIRADKTIVYYALDGATEAELATILESLEETKA